MSYLSQDAIASNSTMQHRVAQCAAVEMADKIGTLDPDHWALTNRRYWSAAPGWDTAWEYALNVHSADADYDPGADEAVITDGQILAQMQSMLQ